MSIVVLCNVITLKSTYSAPIIPFRITFGKDHRSLDEHTSASIGPGLGGSPILVDTRNINNRGYVR